MKNYIKVVDFGDRFFKFIVIVFLDFFKSGKKYKKLFQFSFFFLKNEEIDVLKD